MHPLFVALDFPAEINQSLAGLCHGVSGAKWADSAHFHLTLRFIGNCDDGLLGDLQYALADIAAPAFNLALKGVGYFPPRGPARVLWAGVEAEPGLMRLRDQVSAAVDALGIEPERRKFAPHITLARFKRGVPPGRLAAFLSDHALFRSAPFTVPEFHLYSSHLRPHGALHRIEASYPLDGGGIGWDAFETDELNA
jgi:2'-5' RNA ligase